MEQLHQTKILLCVLSPRYIESDWCLRELQEFLKVVESYSELSIDYKSRIFKVIKTPVPLEKQPEDIQGLLGYEFFELDKQGRPLEFMPDKESPFFKQYWIKLNEVAYDISQFIKDLEKYADEASSPPEKTIYLAETTSDLHYEYKKIKWNLQQQEYSILPGNQLPVYGDVSETIRNYLKRCRLSINMIGERYGPIPEGEEKSIIELQNDLAAEQCQNVPLFHRLIWIPPDLTSEKRQQDFIDSLQKDKAQVPRTEIDRSKLEDFKTLVQDTLKKIAEPPKNGNGRKPAGPKRIYLICDQPDLELIRPIDDCLYDEGFEILLPLFEGDEDQRLQIHLDYLCLCDAAMVYYNFASEPWLSCKLNDLRKAPGYGRDRPLAASAVYITGKKTQHKYRFRTHEFHVIKKFEPFAPDHINPFISRLKDGNGGAA